MTERILCVDDDPNILSALTRQLRKQFDLETAPGGENGLELLAQRGPFAVVVSDMQMPRMSGIEFLRHVRERSPLSVRMMLTGNADQQTAADAVNEGCIFRFLNKPCPPDTMARALRAGLEQYQLVTAEKQLLEETLRGSVKVLTEVLALVSPIAFGRAARVQGLVRKLAAACQVRDSWRLDLAAMLSQIGCVTISEPILDKVYHGMELTAQEQQMFARHPEIGRDLIAKIPRLEGVADIVANQDRRFDGHGALPNGSHGDAIPVESRILKVALDFDSFESRNHDRRGALRALRARPGWYDPFVLEALERICAENTSYTRREVTLNDMRSGMILDQGVLNANGVVLVGKGQVMTETLLYRLQNIARHFKIREPIAVLVSEEP